MRLKIAIVGGGIAGLAAALALGKNGYQVRVFERASTFDDIGAGIQLSPNANHALMSLGLFDAVKAISFEPDLLQLINGKTGKPLSALPFKTLMQQRYRAPYFVAHRGDLQSVLLEAVSQISNLEIQSSKLINRFNDNGDSIEIVGEKFDLLIAADGIHSALRNQIDPKANTVSDGQTAWRATLQLYPSSEKTVSVYMNAGAHLVAYPMGTRPVLNLVYVSSADRPPSADRFGGKAAELISAANDWRPWPLASVQNTVWHKGRAVMIGDAAHAMTPHAAQGGAMAIEDAVVLADCLKAEATIETASLAFQARATRIAKVRALSAQNRTIYQMGGVMAFGRNLVMPFIPPSVLLKRLDWLYGWEP